MHPSDSEADVATQNKLQNVTRILINATHPRQSNGKYGNVNARVRAPRLLILDANLHLH